MNSIISTAKGFIKNVELDNKYQPIITYTNKIRYAKFFNNKGAEKFLQKYNLDGFIYKPFEEEPLYNLWEVRINEDYTYSVSTKIKEYIAQPVRAIYESDGKFLNDGKLTKSKYYNETDAKAKALELNLEMLNDLKNKLGFNKNNELSFSDLKPLMEVKDDLGRIGVIQYIDDIDNIKIKFSKNHSEYFSMNENNKLYITK